ncbi:MAG: 5-(carboxyamino)imidazole ribonucleotide mutase [Lachnospiraceae bacterium]|nr:5-(carboxyamino)imidazole ribonucleotide mutase [Lachnospiraceae bacterium]
MNKETFSVGIVMGSDSDLKVMSQAADVLEALGVSFEIRILSAHREPQEFFDYAKAANERYKIIIAGAGKAAHLPGMTAALFDGPVIGVPMKTSDLGGVDSLYSIVQMPSGIPVATVAIGGAANAGLLAARMLAMTDDRLLERYRDYVRRQKEAVIEKDERLSEIGYKEYLAQ